MAVFNRNCKADTRGLFINSGGGAVDLAQNKALGFANLANNTTYLTQASTLFATRSPREISVVANLSNSQTGILVNYGSTDGTQYIYRVEVSAGAVSFRQAGSVLASVPLPGVNGTPSSYVIHWSTGFDDVSSTHYSEFAVCRLASGAWTISRANHAQPPAAGGGWQFNLSGYGAGSSLFSGGLSNITSVRISRRFHSTTEAREDWQTESSTPAPTGYVPGIELAPVSSEVYQADPDDPVADAILDPLTFAGPAQWLTALHSGVHRQRLYSPIINVEMNNPPTLQSTWAPTEFYKVDQQGFFYGVNHLYVCPCPRTPGSGGLYGRVWVHVQTWVAGGAPGGTTPKLRVIARASSTPVGEDASYSQIVQCTTNHGSNGIGQILDLGEISLRPFLTFLALGLDFSSGTGNTFRRAKIKAIAVDCFVKEV